MIGYIYASICMLAASAFLLREEYGAAIGVGAGYIIATTTVEIADWLRGRPHD